jgi:hypothetical protein
MKMQLIPPPPSTGEGEGEGGGEQDEFPPVPSFAKGGTGRILKKGKYPVKIKIINAKI